METVTIRKAKAELSRLIQKACRGEDIVISSWAEAGGALGRDRG